MLPFLNQLAASQRVLLLALALVPLLVIAVATVPAYLVLPFLPDGVDRAARLLATQTAWLRTALAGTRA
ncbi:dTMP kinase [Kitasatospora sp. NPDC006697]|uniref:dTMP kinase n=1 Tax=Kitasatospora sp. NPDC006697 TaxID=3364020 RepID=UPI0036B5FCF0